MKILYLLIATLKFLGIAFLILLLLLLFLVIIILIVPIKYNVYISKSEEIYVYTSIKWLYSIVGMDIIYNSGSETINKFKLFGMTIGPKKPKKFNKSNEIKTKVIKKTNQNIENEEIEHPKEDSTRIKKSEETQKESPQKTKKAKKEKNIKKKKTSIKEIITQIQAFRYKKELLADTISWIGKILKDIVPSTLYMEIEIGKEDPADTGQLIAMVSALYPLYYSFASIVGNYEKECFYAKIEANGDITLGRLVYDFIKYIRTTSVKQLIKLIRKNRKGKNNGRKVTK